MSVKRAEPTETSMCVRSPASRSRISRSKPIAPPSTAARLTRRSTSAHEGSGTDSLDGAALCLPDFLDPLRGEVEQLVELVTAERSPLGGRLHLDQAAVAGHDHVEVDLGTSVLHVVEVEEGLAAHESGRDGSDRVAQRVPEAEALQGAATGDVRAGDGCAARAPVGLEDVAVEPERALAEHVEVGDGPDPAAPQPLDPDRPALPPAAPP